MEPIMRNLRPTPTNSCLPVVLLLVLALFVVDDATAQRRKRVDERRNPTEATVEEPGQDVDAGKDESSVSSLKMFVYPAEEQSPEQQERDEAECATWAEEQVGEMPATSTPEEASADDDSGRRRDRQRGGRGGLKGAAVGAVVGEALDDDEPEFSRGDFDPEKAGDKVKDADSPAELRRDLEKATRDDGLSGAETGAIVGAVAGKRRQTKQQQSAAEAEVTAEPAESAASDSLRSAIKVCLESRGYRVDY
jgi:hypothetical protein